MRLIRLGVIAPFFLLAAPVFASHRIHRGPTSARSAHHKAHPAVAKAEAPRVMDTQRATQIQSALIAKGYLTGEPSGQWDEPTQQAMAKLQAANGWQTKLVPDSRALIKLGLGPGATTASPIAESVNPENASESKQ